MASLNVPAHRPTARTYEGAVVNQLTPIKELFRSVMTSLLWEPNFYENGNQHALRIKALIPKCDPLDVAAMALTARKSMHLRHTPLFLARELARVKGNGPLVADTLFQIIDRPDELTEYVAMYYGGKANVTPRSEPLSAGSKRGLARAFAKFNAYSFAKYDRDGQVKLSDVLRLVHPKPSSPEQSELYRQVRTRTLPIPTTWETELSSGKDKKKVFEQLLEDNKLGGLAFLRNLRNMVQAGVDPALIDRRFKGNFDRVLPFRFIAAARHAPSLATSISDAMVSSCEQYSKLDGTTVVLVDVSGSMDHRLSGDSEMTRLDAATSMAIIMRELCSTCRTFSFSNTLVEVANWRGLPLAKALSDSQLHSNTYLGDAVAKLNEKVNYDRLIIITDEQSADKLPAARTSKSYVVNIGTYQNSVVWGDWIGISGWSERVVDFIQMLEEESK